MALEEAGLASKEHLQAIHPSIWRITTTDNDLAIKLFDGPNSAERLRTEFAACTHLAKTGAPVPTAIWESTVSRTLVRSWIPGQTLHERLIMEDPISARDATGVHSAWADMIQTLALWQEHIPKSRLLTAFKLRRHELEMVAEAITEAHPSIPPCALEKLLQDSMVSGLSTVPLDASASNIVLGPDGITFIDLEMIGFDFPYWMFAKYVTTTTKTGGKTFAPSLITALPDETTNIESFDAALTLVLLLSSSGAWAGPPMMWEEIAANLPSRSSATDHIRSVLT